MNKLHAKLGVINRLMLGAKIISLVTEGVLFDDELLKYPEPLQTIKFKPGIFIDRIIWGELKYSCIRNKDVRNVFSDLEKNRLQYWQPIYKEYYQDIISTSEKFDNYLISFNRYIRSSHIDEWLVRLSSTKELLSLREAYTSLGFDVNKIKDSLLAFIDNPVNFVAEQNKVFVEKELVQKQQLFDQLETHPLTVCQRESCVYDEDNVLVIAGAGTGKTSSMVAKAAYLVKKGLARPDEILMLAFGKDARQELEDRVYELDYLNGVVTRTFHSLGKEIIGRYENSSTDVSVLASDDVHYIKFIDNQLEKMVDETTLGDELHTFFTQYQYPQPNDLDFKSHGKYLQYVKDNEIRDLAGNLVKSFEELRISNYLFKNGIRFEYECDYPHPVSSPGRNVYKPDYYLPDLDVYIEHFGIDKNGKTRPGINAIKYNKDREWKVKIHEEFGTTLIQTFSYQTKQGLEKVLQQELLKYCNLNDIDFETLITPLTTKNLFRSLKELGSYKEFSKLIANYLTLFKSSPYDIESLPIPETNLYNSTRIKLFHSIFKWIFNQYCSVLNRNKKMDFADMIRRADEIVSNGDFHERTQSKYKFKYIMVDEFQDISPIRASLIKSLRDAGTNCALFCVGDDWQAIYRFTGSDINLTTNYSDHFGTTYPVILDKTFRFNNRIESVASGFIQKNDNQLRKNLITQTTSDKTEVNILTGHKEEVVREILEKISLEAAPKASVLILSRFKQSLKHVASVKNEFPMLIIKLMTAHGSKGKQSDYVVILDVIDGKYGFPSKVTTDPLLESLLPTVEKFSYAEERRLFYVALTRAKNTVFIHTVLGKESEFITELTKDGYDIQCDKNDLYDYVIETAHCPECGTGTLIPRMGQFGLFYVCSLGKDYCDTLVQRCPSCEKAPLLRNLEYHYCADPDCGFRADCCPACMTGRLLVRENTRTGSKFIGCSNYKSNERGSCTYTVKIKGSVTTNKGVGDN